jgi:hypothetical protein
MSLINDALKKAQKQRTGEAPALGSLPSVGGESARSISRRSKSSGPNPLLLGGGLAGVLVLGLGAFTLLRDKPPSPGAKPQDEPAVALAKAGQPATPPALTATAPSPVAKSPDESAVGPAKADTFTPPDRPKNRGQTSDIRRQLRTWRAGLRTGRAFCCPDSDREAAGSLDAGIAYRL